MSLLASDEAANSVRTRGIQKAEYVEPMAEQQARAYYEEQPIMSTVGFDGRVYCTPTLPTTGIRTYTTYQPTAEWPTVQPLPIGSAQGAFCINPCWYPRTVPLSSIQEDVVTPTNACAPFGLVVSATPEFVHPRKPDVPQWLMSPPVTEASQTSNGFTPVIYRSIMSPLTNQAVTPENPPGLLQRFQTVNQSITLEQTQPKQPCAPLIQHVAADLFNSASPQENASQTAYPYHHSNKNCEKTFPTFIFWDMESCQVETNNAIQRIIAHVRQTYVISGHVEHGFYCFMDIKHQSTVNKMALAEQQVKVIQVPYEIEHVLQRKLSELTSTITKLYAAPATAIFITGSKLFSHAMGELRNNHNYFVMLFCNNGHKNNQLQNGERMDLFSKEDRWTKLCTLECPFPRSQKLFLSVNWSSSLAANVITPFSDLVAEVLSQQMQTQAILNDGVSNSSHAAATQNRQINQREYLAMCHPLTTLNEETYAENFPRSSERVKLTISNIDAHLGLKSIRHTMWKQISQYTQVLSLQVRPHNRFTVICDVTVPHVYDATRVLEHLQRQKIGTKRILVTLSHDKNIQEANSITRCLELGKLSSNYFENGNFKPAGFLSTICKLHCASDNNHAKHHKPELKMEVGLREFSAKLHMLLHTHNGILQLKSFKCCFEAECGVFPRPSSYNTGVYLEHQISYVPGVQIITSEPHGVKCVVWSQIQSDNGSETASETSSNKSTCCRWKSPSIIQFGKQVVDLLKGQSFSVIPMSNFPSSYQMFFGWQCNPKDYGIANLNDLLNAIPHVLQIMGPAENRLLTLTHRAQVKRFTHEIVKILKATPDRAILVTQLPDIYSRTLNRSFNLCDYGVSVLSDLLDDIPEGHILTTGEGDNIVLSLPKRERTTEEKERTNQFSLEVLEILRNCPHYKIPFTDFVPTYHRKFGRQCKLANFGFTKLVDLFEALPTVVQITEVGTEKYLVLTASEKLRVFSSQVVSLIKCSVNEGSNEMLLANLPSFFHRQFGFQIKPLDFDANSIVELLRKISHAVSLANSESGEAILCLSHHKSQHNLISQLLCLILDQNSNRFEIDQLMGMYFERYGSIINPEEYGFLSAVDIFKKCLPDAVQVEFESEGNNLFVRGLYQQARIIRRVLLDNKGSMNLGEFNVAYRVHIGRAADFESLGFSSWESLLRAIPNVVTLKGFGIKKTISLRPIMKEKAPAVVENFSKLQYEMINTNKTTNRCKLYDGVVNYPQGKVFHRNQVSSNKAYVPSQGGGSTMITLPSGSTPIASNSSASTSSPSSRSSFNSSQNKSESSANDVYNDNVFTSLNDAPNHEYRSMNQQVPTMTQLSTMICKL